MRFIGRIVINLAAAGLVYAVATANPIATSKVTGPEPIPQNFVQISPCERGEGVHFADVTKPFEGATIYGAYDGKPVFTEIMLTPEQLSDGGSWVNTLRPLPGFKIDHVDIEFLKHGHQGMPFAHYDLHAFYVPHAEHLKFCPKGPA